MFTTIARALLLLLAFALQPSRLCADEYPSRPVELIVPFPPGGGTDLVTRLVSEGLSRRLGQGFVIVNRPGANTNVGTLAAVRAKPDGYTLLIASFGLIANPSLYKKLAFDPQTDLVPIIMIANTPTVLVVSEKLPVKSLAEFIAYVKARPGEINYASYGVGSSPHLAAGLFQNMTGSKMVHVPYNGGGPAALGVMTGEVQALFSSVVTALGMIRGGQLRPIAMASSQRLEILPDVPTFAEQGLDYKFGTWYGLLAPAKTAPEVIEKLNQATRSVLAEPVVRARIVEQGAEIISGSPAEFGGFIREETERLRSVIRDANIQLD